MIVIIGTDLTRVVRDKVSRRFLSPQMAMQTEIRSTNRLRRWLNRNSKAGQHRSTAQHVQWIDASMLGT